MPTKGNPRRTFRFEPGLWDAFMRAAGRDPHGRVPAVIVRDFIAWYASQRGARKPERPPKDDGPAHDSPGSNAASDAATSASNP